MPIPSQPRVLLADDDQAVRAALGDVLESEGFEVVRAANGHEALAKFRERSAEIVLLDLNMPVKGGWDTLERLRNINPFLPVIILTAQADARPAAMAAGVALMEKPLDIPRLLKAIRELLAQPTEQRLAHLAKLQTSDLA